MAHILSSRTAGVLVATILALGGSFACGGSDNSSDFAGACSGDCDCQGFSCTCRTGGKCTFGSAVTPTSADGGAVPPDNASFECESKNTCDSTCGSGCTSSCSGQSTCEGTCASNCTSTCTGTSTCTLETGTNSSVTCSGGSHCSLTLDLGSKVECQGNSTCAIECPKGGCTASCGGSATCTIECGGTEACHVTCNGKGSDDCAAGTTCAACGKSG